MLIALLAIGSAGLLSIGLFMYFSPAEIVEAGSRNTRGLIGNLSGIFTVPMFMFFLVMFTFAVSELYKTYQKLHDPEFYKQRRRQSHG